MLAQVLPAGNYLAYPIPLFPILLHSLLLFSFTAELDYYGEVRSVELKPGGADVAVTAGNRREYVRLYTHWLLEASIEKQFSAFRSGFLRVCGGPALTLFSPPELELLICGLPHLDFEALEGVSRYEGGYSR
jgi:hypothetical protein